MKKLLLLAASLVLAISANAENWTHAIDGYTPLYPQWFENAHYTVMSPNGKYAAGQNEYTMAIDVINLETGENQTFAGETEAEFYTLGVGANTISNDGIVLISTTYDGTAAYIQDSIIKFLPMPEGCAIGLCNAITPDGSRIAGTIGVPMDVNAQQVMQRPVIWNRQEDSTYAAPIELPYPTVDITGRLPQYVLVDGISQDGKTLACQIIDYSGMLPQPMIMQEGADGTWTYKTLGAELINPGNIELPAYPGEGPNPEDYMNDEEKAAYAAALEAAANAVEPNPIDFMTEEEYNAFLAAQEEGFAWAPAFMTEEEAAAYDAALTAYYAISSPNPADYLSEASAAAYATAWEEWGPMFDAFNEAFMMLQASAVVFDMNSLVISPNGKYYATPGTTIDMDTWMEDTKIYILDLENGTVTIKGAEGQTLIPTQITDNGGVLAVKLPSVWGDLPTTDAYLCTSLDAEFTPLQDYVQANCHEELYKWMTKEMLHEYTTVEWDEEKEEDIVTTQNVWFTGMPCCDAEMKHIMTSVYNGWSEEGADAYSYYMPMNYQGIEIAIKNINDDHIGIQLAGNGEIRLTGKASNLSVYDMSGRKVLDVKNPAETIQTGLGHGAYVIKAEGQTVKVVR